MVTVCSLKKSRSNLRKGGLLWKSEVVLLKFSMLNDNFFLMFGLGISS